MHRGLLTSLAISAVAVPSLVAAAYLAPSDLLKAAELKGQPMEISYELHGGAEGVRASAWLKGAVEATDPRDVSTVKAALRFTVDVVMPEEGSMRVRTQVRITDSMAYMQLEEVTGSIQDLPLPAIESHIGKWYSVSLRELQENEEIFTMEQEEVEELTWKVLDTILSMQRTPEGNGSVYSLKLKRTAWKDIVPVILEVTAEDDFPLDPPTNRDLAELRRMFRKLNLHIKVMTDANDTVTGVKFYTAIRDTGFDGVFQGTAIARLAAVTVSAPRTAVPLDELMMQ